MASAGYPASSSKGDVISGLDEVGGVEITHAGTERRGRELVTAGGRVLNVTGLGPTLEDARSRAFAAVERIHFDGAQYRPDIAARVAEQVAG
jgi:phosphoribosylamine--glycine ligase